MWTIITAQQNAPSPFSWTSRTSRTTRTIASADAITHTALATCASSATRATATRTAVTHTAVTHTAVTRTACAHPWSDARPRPYPWSWSWSRPDRSGKQRAGRTIWCTTIGRDIGAVFG